MIGTSSALTSRKATRYFKSLPTEAILTLNGMSVALMAGFDYSPSERIEA